MKRILFLITLLLSICTCASGQVAVKEIIQVTTNPVGTTCVAGKIYYNSITGVNLERIGGVCTPITAGGTPGNVVGPASATAGDVPLLDVTGKILTDSGKAPSTDGTLGSNSDAKLPTEKAVKTYADTKQPLDSDLTTIASLAPTTDNFMVAVSSAWASRTVAQVKTTLALDNVTNTSDANKPVSTAQAAADALSLKIASNLADLNSASAARTNLGGTTVGVGFFTFTNPSAIRFPRIESDNSVTGRTAAQVLSDIAALPLAGGTLTGNLIFTDNTLDIGASGATRPRTGYFGTSLISPLFNGLAITNNGTNTLNIAAGKTLQVDQGLEFDGTNGTKMTFPGTSATVARTDAQNTWTGNQIFASDNTYDIGASGASRPRDFFLGRNATVGSILTVNGGRAIVDGTTTPIYDFYETGVQTGRISTSGGTMFLSTITAAAINLRPNSTTAMSLASGGAITLTSGITNAAGTPGSLCYNTSTFEMTKNNALTCTVSSRKFKQGILGLPINALSGFDRLRPVQFAYKDQPNRLRYGFIAEEAGAADKRFADGYDAKGSNPTSIDQNAILAATVAELQNLKQQMLKLTAQVVSQQRAIKQLRRRR